MAARLPKRRSSNEPHISKAAVLLWRGRTHPRMPPLVVRDVSEEGYPPLLPLPVNRSRNLSSTRTILSTPSPDKTTYTHSTLAFTPAGANNRTYLSFFGGETCFVSLLLSLSERWSRGDLVLAQPVSLSMHREEVTSHKLTPCATSLSLGVKFVFLSLLVFAHVLIAPPKAPRKALA